METKRDMETMAEWASTMDAYDRLIERRRRRAKFIHRFRYFTPWPVAIVDDPVAAVSASGGPLPMLPSGADTGAAGSRGSPSTAALTPSTSGSLPGGPTHHSCSEASRISAATTWHH